MTKLKKEIEIIAALIDGKVIVSAHTSRYKLQDNKMMFWSYFDSKWVDSSVLSLYELTFSAYEIEKEPQPKFSIGQEVWFMSGNKIHSDNIVEIRYCINNVIRFETNSVYVFNDNIFASKQELLESL